MERVKSNQENAIRFTNSNWGTFVALKIIEIYITLTITDSVLLTLHAPPLSVPTQIWVLLTQVYDSWQIKFEVTESVANCRNCVGMASLSRFPVLPQPAVVADQSTKDKLASERRGIRTGRIVVPSTGASRLRVRMARSSRPNSQLKFGWTSTLDTEINVPMFAMFAAFNAMAMSVSLLMERKF